MKCLKTRILRQYIDNEFSQRRKKKIEDHLAKCSDCLRKLEKVKERTDFIQGKIETLGPKNIPETDFGYPKKVSGRISPSFIRIPVPVFSLMVGIIFMMAIGLFLQGQKISRLKSPIFGDVKKPSLNTTAGNNYKDVFIELDLEGYTPIKNPKIIVIKGTASPTYEPLRAPHAWGSVKPLRGKGRITETALRYALSAMPFFILVAEGKCLRYRKKASFFNQLL